MEHEGIEVPRKLMKLYVEEKERLEDGATVENLREESDTNAALSEHMELGITHILEKIERFTHMVSELLESGKLLLKELSNEFEERMILVHKEQIEKWQEEIKELHSLDASNEEVNALLCNAQYLLQNVHSDS